MNKAFRDLPKFLEIANLRQNVQKCKILLLRHACLLPSSTFFNH